MSADNSKPVFIDLLTVRAGKKSGVYLEGEVKGVLVYMPLTLEGARQIAADLVRAADAVNAK
jgi:hypothetical protein